MLLFVMLGDEEQKVAANSLRPGVLAVLLDLVGNHIVKKEKERASGSLHTIFSMAKPGKEYLIIGKDLVSTFIYGKCIRNAIGRRGRITAILDGAGMGEIKAGDITKVMFKTVDKIYLGDISKPAH